MESKPLVQGKSSRSDAATGARPARAARSPKLAATPSGDKAAETRRQILLAAASLFRLLHEIDATGVARIAVAPIPHQDLGEAINDRLLRAAAPRDAS